MPLILSILFENSWKKRTGGEGTTQLRIAGKTAVKMEVVVPAADYPFYSEVTIRKNT